jgi:hypothetical protein
VPPCAAALWFVFLLAYGAFPVTLATDLHSARDAGKACLPIAAPRTVDPLLPPQESAKQLNGETKIGKEIATLSVRAGPGFDRCLTGAASAVGPPGQPALPASRPCRPRRPPPPRAPHARHVGGVHAAAGHQEAGGVGVAGGRARPGRGAQPLVLLGGPPHACHPLAALYLSLSLLDSSPPATSTAALPQELADSLKPLDETVALALTKAQKDNSVIYLEKVPPFADLPPIQVWGLP